MQIQATYHRHREPPSSCSGTWQTTWLPEPEPAAFPHMGCSGTVASHIGVAILGHVMVMRGTETRAAVGMLNGRAPAASCEPRSKSSKGGGCFDFSAREYERSRARHLMGAVYGAQEVFASESAITRDERCRSDPSWVTRCPSSRHRRRGGLAAPSVCPEALSGGGRRLPADSRVHSCTSDC